MNKFAAWGALTAAVVLAGLTWAGAGAAVERSGEMRWRGGFDCAASYEPGDIVFFEGSSYIIREPARECMKPSEPPWELLAPGGEHGSPGKAGPLGQAGSPGTFDGRFESPDGRFKVLVANVGISLVGPNASVQVTPASVNVSGDATVSVKSGAAIEVRGASSVVAGSVVFLGGTTGCRPLARKDDPVTGSVAPVSLGPSGPVVPQGPVIDGKVNGGSPTVLAC